MEQTNYTDATSNYCTTFQPNILKLKLQFENMIDDRFNANKTICMRQHLLVFFLLLLQIACKIQKKKKNLDIGRFHIVCSVWFVTTTTTKIKQNTATQLRWSYWNNENRKETRINTLHTQRLSHWF